ncbi:MAG: hypothetical protein P8176_07910 [Gammaproteobacteria bacterium]
MNLGKILRAAAATVLVAASATSYATFIRTGDVILDDRTGLEWYRVDAPRGYSFDSLQSELLGGGRFEGYHVATRSDIEDLLFNSVGYDSSLSAADNYATIKNFVDTFENLAASTFSLYLGSQFQDGASSGILTASYNFGLNEGSAHFSYGIPTQYGDPEVGWFLFKVPVASTSLMFLLTGIGTLVALRMMKKTRLV